MVVAQIPTDEPTIQGELTDFLTSFPTSHPTFHELMTQDNIFRQEFMLGNGRQFSKDEISFIERLYADYTISC